MLPVKKFTDLIEQNNLFNNQNKVLLAVSSGMDSVLMAHLFRSVGYNFGIAHCNFQLRGDESVAEQVFAKELAQQFEVPFHTINFDTLAYTADKKISVQMAARELRYQWFEQIRQQFNYDLIATAHHQNDAIETILLNLTRGTGIAGMHGILLKSGVIIRPLLFLTRDEIKSIAIKNKLAYKIDSSNASSKYARNKIRHEVVPKLKEINPALEHTFENNLAHFRDMEVLLEQRLAELRETILHHNDYETYLLIDEIRKLEPKRLLLFKLLQPYGFNEGVVDDLIRSLNKHSGKIFTSANYQLILDRDKLVLLNHNVSVNEPVLIRENTHSLHYGNYKLTLLHDDSALIITDNPFATAVDADKLVYPLTLRPWQVSDSFYPLGMKARKKLSDFFIGQKIPVHLKNEVPVLINGNSDIIWLGGYRPDERYKVSDNTKKVTIFELYKLT